MEKINDNIKMVKSEKVQLNTIEEALESLLLWRLAVNLQGVRIFMSRAVL